MIISKPKSTAIAALGIFTIICFAIGGYGFRAVISGGAAWYHYMIALLGLIIAHVLLFRQIFSYKIISIGDKLVRIKYPLRFKSTNLKFSDIIHWKETIIKTKNAPFKQMELKFENNLFKLSIQENTNYEQIKKYLKKKASKKELK